MQSPLARNFVGNQSVPSATCAVSKFEKRLSQLSTCRHLICFVGGSATPLATHYSISRFDNHRASTTDKQQTRITITTTYLATLLGPRRVDSLLYLYAQER
jgi:hypothetical protein